MGHTSLSYIMNSWPYRITANEQPDMKQPNNGGTHNQEVLANSQETTSKRQKRRKPKNDHPSPAAPKKTQTQKVLLPACYS